MNKSIILGRLTKDPEIKILSKTQSKVANFTLAVDRKYVTQGEERQTDFLNIVAYSKLAEVAETYLKQGMQICLSGRIQTRTWQDNDLKKHYATEIIAEEISFTGAMKKDDNKDIQAESNIGIDDLPF